MWRVILETPPRREDLQGFGLAVGFLGGVLAAWIVGVPTGSGLLALAVGFALWIGVSGLAWRRPDLLEPVYRGWNRAAKAYARRARRVVLGICFFTVIAVVRLAGGKLEIGSQTEESRWRSRTTLSADEYRGLGRGRGSGHEAREGNLRAWASRSGNGWIVFLIPFLRIIEAFDVRDGIATPEGIYTLY